MGVAPSWGDQIVWVKRFYHASALASTPAQSASGTLRQPLLIESWRLVEPKNGKSYAIKLVKIPCHKTPYRRPHRLNLSSQSSRSCAGPNIKMLKDKDLEFANSIRDDCETTVPQRPWQLPLQVHLSVRYHRIEAITVEPGPDGHAVAVLRFLQLGHVSCRVRTSVARTAAGWKLWAAAVTMNRPRSRSEKPRSRWR